MLESFKKRRMFFIYAFLKTLPIAAIPAASWYWREHRINTVITVAATIVWALTLAYEWRKSWREAKAQDLGIDIESIE